MGMGLGARLGLGALLWLGMGSGMGLGPILWLGMGYACLE